MAGQGSVGGDGLHRTWGATILYWRNSGTVPTGMQMLAYLGLLPVGLSGAGFMLRNAARRGAEWRWQEKPVRSDAARTRPNTVSLAPRRACPGALWPLRLSGLQMRRRCWQLRRHAGARWALPRQLRHRCG
jgi:hypothetical protein